MCTPDSDGNCTIVGGNSNGFHKNQDCYQCMLGTWVTKPPGSSYGNRDWNRGQDSFRINLASRRPVIQAEVHNSIPLIAVARHTCTRTAVVPLAITSGPMDKATAAFAIAAGKTADGAVARSRAATKEFEEAGVRARFTIPAARSAIRVAAGRGISAVQRLPVVEEEEAEHMTGEELRTYY